MGNFNVEDYVTVNTRVQSFYEKYPDGSIQTELVSFADGVVVMKARAFRNGQDNIPATGHAYEKEGSSFINKTSALENCETSAVGRALAMMGFHVSKSIASREEVENARHQQEQPDKSPRKATTPRKPDKSANIDDYVIPKGKQKGKKISDVDTATLKSMVSYLRKSGDDKELQGMIEAFFGAKGITE